MTNKRLILLLFGIITLTLGCDDAFTGPEPRSGEQVQQVQDLRKTALANNVSRTTADVQWFEAVPGTRPPAGTSTLTRNSNGATATLKTSGIPTGHVATIWGVIFNKPEECDSSPCGESDLGNPDVAGSVLGVSGGHVVGGGDYANFGGRINEGDVSEALFGLGLMDAKTAEIHLVVRDHGPKIPGMVDDQIHTLNGGCDPNKPIFTPGEIPDEPGECNDLQFSIHLPVAD